MNACMRTELRNQKRNLNQMKDTAGTLRAKLKSQELQLRSMAAQLQELLLEQAWLRKARKIMHDAGRVDFVTAIGKHVVQGLLPMRSYRCELLENEARNGWRMGSARHGARYSGAFLPSRFLPCTL